MPIATSLRIRVLVWVSVALTALFAIALVGLDAAFRRNADAAMRELLQGQLLGLIALAEPDGRGGLELPEDAINPQFQVADSGLYGLLWDADGDLAWQSLSMLGRDLAAPSLPAPGARTFATIEQPGLPAIEVLLMGIAWEFDDGRVEFFTFASGVSREPYAARQRAFRANLIGWFAAITGAMLAVLTGLLAWVMRPLKRLARQVGEVERGQRSRMSADYPTELTGLAANLNTLIDTERRRLTRYRNTLDDLAHSLKTPLAAMRSLLSERGDLPGGDALQAELERMDQRVSYQLRRARVGGATGFGLEPVSVAPSVEDLVQTLDKVYRDKGVHCRWAVEPGAVFHGDAGDLTEILGNLLDNAYKYCRSQVELDVSVRNGRLTLRVDDDGPGIARLSVDKLLERGGRADESVPGQGIGLAVVKETAELYSGRLAVAESPLGGARVTVELGRAVA